MGQEEQPNTEKNTENTNSQPSPVNLSEPPPKQNKSYEKREEPQDINKISPVKATDGKVNRKISWTNVIGWLTLFVNAGFLWYTANLFTLTSKQTQIADSALKLANKANEIAFKSSQDNSIDMAADRELNREYIANQIKFLTEQQHQFVVNNEPYLWVKTLEFEVDLNVPHAIPTIAMEFANIGRYPVKTTNASYNISFLDTNTSGNSFNHKPLATAYMLINQYIGSNGVVRFAQRYYGEITNLEKHHFTNSGLYNLYCYGYIDYINLVNKKKHKYTYCMCYNYVNKQLQILQSDNIPIP